MALVLFFALKYLKAKVKYKMVGLFGYRAVMLPLISMALYGPTSGYRLPLSLF
jgi:hypothetical protein